MEILFVKGDNVSNVRLSKYFSCLVKEGVNVSFWGWDRLSESKNSSLLTSCEYLLSGGGFGGKILPILYLVWMFKVFIKALCSKGIRTKNIIAINFDSAFPIFIASKIRRFNFIYEVHDEFALSYNFPVFIKAFIRWLDHRIMSASLFVIHVDENRVNYKKCLSVIIENSPEDYFNSEERNYDYLERCFAVIGNISRTRGIDQIYEFAKRNSDITIMVVGKFYDQSFKDKLLRLTNIEYYDYMPQDELFSKMEKCCAIFSLYDPCLEINRLAASNKVYDAMMMGIPVITNHEVINSSFIEENEVGIVVDYKFNETWEQFAKENFLSLSKDIGKKGRTLYLKAYRFDILVRERLLCRL